MKKEKINNKNAENGLTLIELSIALIIIGLLTTSFLQLYNIQQQKRLKELQDYKVFTIADGLARYLSEHQHYPCPARRDRDVTDSDFGDITSPPLTDTNGDTFINEEDHFLCNDTVVADNSCDIAGHGYCVAVNAGKRIRIGAIPYKAIGVGKEDVIDVYGNQFTYAVVEDQASYGSYILHDPAIGNPDNRKIIVHDFVEDEATRDSVTGIATSGVDTALPAEIVFFSHGAGGAGSYTASGNANIGCPAAAQIDSENCDNDAEFVTDIYSVRSGAASGIADDKLVHNLLKWIYIWDTAADDTKSIYNRDSGNMGVGIEDGEEKLHIIGNLRVDDGGEPDAGKLQTRDLCDENENDCFISEVLGGDAASSERLKCPDKFFMRAIENGQAVCVSALGDGSSNTCGGVQAARTLSLDASTGNITLGCYDAL